LSFPTRRSSDLPRDPPTFARPGESCYPPGAGAFYLHSTPSSSSIRGNPVSRAKRPVRRRSAAISKPRARRQPAAPEVEAFEAAVDAETLVLPPSAPAELVEHEPETPL